MVPDALRMQWPPSPCVLSLRARSSYPRPAEQKLLHRAAPPRYTHGRSLRAVADRLLRILIAMLTTRTLFDCSKARTREIETLSEKVA